MIREIFITLYLMLFSVIFHIARLFPVQKKVVFCVSFIENNAHIYKEIRRLYPETHSVLLAYNESSYDYFANRKENRDMTILFSPKKLHSFIRSIYHLATAKVVIIDNYYGFLAEVTFKKDVHLLQIWHANGAIKKFGLEDPSIQHRSKRANRRFRKVYRQFQYLLVGSKKMEQIFGDAFGLPSSHMLRLGIPRTDLFFQQNTIQTVKKELATKYPFIQNKKVILYAPTFRDNQIEDFTISLDFQKLKDKLSNDYVFLLKLHPAIKNTVDTKNFNGFLYDFSNYPKMNDLLFISDYLITDYSSIPFEYSFLNKPMIFYPYDLEDYKSTRGFWTEYQDLVPGPIVYSTEEIIDVIVKGKTDISKVSSFHLDWNEYSAGNASRNVALQINTWLNE